MSAERVISRLSTMFGEPRTDNPDDYIEEFIDAMRGYDGDVLMAACDQIIKTANFFPRPGELLSVAGRIAAARAAGAKVYSERETEFEKVGPDDPRFTRALNLARVDAPAYAKRIEARGWIKVKREPDGPMKRQTASVVSEITKRMTGERD